MQTATSYSTHNASCWSFIRFPYIIANMYCSIYIGLVLLTECEPEIKDVHVHALAGQLQSLHSDTWTCRSSQQEHNSCIYICRASANKVHAHACMPRLAGVDV